MANENIGVVACAFCGGDADVRRYKTGKRKLYFSCVRCGMIQPSLPGGQNWIGRNARFFDDDAPAAPAPANDTAPSNPETESQPKPRRRRGFFGGIDL